MRLIDPRINKVTAEIETHTGVKGGRALWMGKHNMIVSCGTSKTPEREILIYDPRSLGQHIHRTAIDSANGLLQPYYDEDTEILFVSGKGDGSIRYYEVELEGPASAPTTVTHEATLDSEPTTEKTSAMLHFISQYSSNEPAATCAFLQKRGCDVNTNEIVRVYKITGPANNQILQPISFKVPRKSDLFQDDIFPACRSDEPAQTKEQWFAGEKCEAGPKVKSLQGGFVKSDKAVPDFAKVEQEKTLSDDEVRKQHAEMVKRVAYLEAELVKRDARIKDLESHHT